MPELAEVECSRAMLEEHCQGKEIKDVIDIESGGGPRSGTFDDKVFEAESIKSHGVFSQALKGTVCERVCRKGKQLWWNLSAKGGAKKKILHPLFHFGLTGSFVVKGVAAMKYMDFKVHDAEWPPKFTKCEIVFKDGSRVAFCDPRRFGRICLREKPLNDLPLSKLAPDPLFEMPPVEHFVEKFAKTTLALKPLLMDQGRAVCGLGNWMVDEVCFQAGVHPETKCSDLNEKEMASVHDAIFSICREASDALKAKQEFPDSWLFHKRWSKKSKTKTFVGKTPVEFIVVGGRTTAIVPSRQKKPSSSSDVKKKGRKRKAEESVDDDEEDEESEQEKEAQKPEKYSKARRQDRTKASPKRTSPRL